ncbi:MAG TPA: protein kinase [Vicinamibacterales bacterium]|nr:protein kinase [Vicinamibacterales bacterium]
MNRSDRWPRVKDIFHSALARAPHERGAFVREECREDSALREDVESLLAAHADAEGFAETPAIAVLARAAADAGAPVAAALAPGVELGPYIILGPLDTGAMGEVYRARDTRLARDVAVKVLPAAFSVDTERIARLEREARLLATLNHPHIATIHSLEVSNGVCALVMELIEGPTLAEHLAGRALPMNRTLPIACQIADALAAAHARGIVHRDLKPANIKLTGSGAVKILDFGLAQAVGPDDRDVGTPGEAGDVPIREDLIAGTPAYMSPEQARGERVDQRADVWAFGCVLYEMLTGQRPFGGTTISETLGAVLDRGPDWQALPPTVPDGIRRLLRRCLEHDPKRRLHHMADARIEIDDAALNGVDDSPAQPKRSRYPERIVVGLVAALAIVVGLLFVQSAPEAPEMRIVDITTPWTSDPSSFALSPDGRRLAFVGDYQGQPTLWVRPFDAAEAQSLPGTQGARRPFWSPDSRSIGFFAFTELKRIDADGGAPQTVTSIIAGTAAAWGAGGTILLSGRMSRTISPSPTGLLRVDVTGGASDIATRPVPQSTGHRYPEFLPGGRQFLFFAGGADDVRGVYVGSLDSSETTRVVASDSQGAYLPPEWLLFVRQGALLAQRFDISRRIVTGEPITVAESVAFDSVTGDAAISTSDTAVFAYRSGRGPVSQLAWFDRSGRPLGTIRPPDEAAVSNPRLSPDGQRVVAERTVRNNTALWLLDRGRQMLFTRTDDDGMARYPVWSPTGNRIAFASVRIASVRLSAKPSEGTEDEEVLLESSQDALLTDWSQDGRFLLYFAPDPKTGTDLWMLPRDTRVPKVFLATAANEMWGQFSPDGRWVAYQSNETGRFEIYVRSFPAGGVAIPISTAGGVYARWSRDGNELYYVAPDATMMAVPIRRTRTTLSADSPVALFRTRRVGGGVNVIGYGHQYDVAPDGRFLMNVELESNPRPITLVMNWKPSSR